MRGCRTNYEPEDLGQEQVRRDAADPTRVDAAASTFSIPSSPLQKPTRAGAPKRAGPGHGRLREDLKPQRHEQHGAADRRSARPTGRARIETL